MSVKAKIILAEDSPTQAIQIEALLQEHGCSVKTAENGRVALDLVRADKPDIVVTDLEMPEMNGLDLVSALQREFKRLPVVLITALGSEQIAAAALKAGAASYVPKQELQDLIPTLDRILAVLQADRANDRLAAYISCAETEFLLDNDDSLVPFLIARLQEDMRLLNLCDENDLVQVATALDEALVNAIVHGNLEVSSELRAVDDGAPYSVLIQQRQQEPPYQERKVLVRFTGDHEKAVIVIRDEGPGFDVGSIPDPTDPENLERVSGRGLLLINAFMDEVSHNQSGNEIRMVKYAAT